MTAGAPDAPSVPTAVYPTLTPFVTLSGMLLGALLPSRRASTWYSNAPMSGVLKRVRGKVTARASNTNPAVAVGLPASMAGLPASRACVCTTPPLLASGPRSGLMGTDEVPILLPLVPLARPLRLVPSPIRLLTPVESSVPYTSSRVVPVPRKLPATIVFLSSGDPPARHSPPPTSPPLALLSLRLFVIVLLMTVSVALEKMPPPYPAAVLPLTVVFVRVRVPVL